MSRTLRTDHPTRAVLQAACATILLGGCAAASLNSAPSPQASGESKPSSSKPSSSKPSSWLAQAWQGWQRAQANPSRPPSPKPRLAFRAPAALEPTLLERLQLAPGSLSSRGLSLDGARLSEFPFALAFAPSASYRSEGLAGGELWGRALRDVAASGERPSEPRPGGTASSWSALQEAMERRQQEAVQQLALRVSRQRRSSSSDEEGLLRADLADDLERVRRVDLDGLAPALGPPERLRRLGELRLKLLSTLAIAPAAQREADAERQKIEVEIRALLREQEKERAALLEKLRREVPARLQAQRQSEIERALARVRQEDAQAVAQLLAGQQRRVREDFGAPARFLFVTPAANAPTRAQISFNKNQFRTFAATTPSLAPIASPAPSLGQVLVPSAQPFLALDKPVETELARSRGGESERHWRSLLSKRVRAWRAPAR